MKTWHLAVIVALAAFIGALFGTMAHAQEPMRGMYCDTKEQVVEVITQQNKGKTFPEALEVVNKKEVVCGFSAVVVLRNKKPLATIHFKDQVIQVEEVYIFAIGAPEGWIPVQPPLPQFMFFKSAGTGV